MNKTINIFLAIIFQFLTSCGQGQIKTPINAMDKFEKFLAKEKFIKDMKILYPGIGNEKLKPILTEKINLSAEDFKKIAKSEKATDEDYQNAIKIGLKRFENIYMEIDTEDRERICTYYEELMDIVGLESSDGLLNDFMYGFNPTE